MKTGSKGRVERVDLGRFMQHPEAQGMVVLVDGTPVLEAHIFPKVYTLVWYSQLNDPKVLRELAQLVQFVAKARIRDARHHSVPLDQKQPVSVSVLREEEGHLEEVKDEPPFWRVLRDSKIVEQFLHAHWQNAVSVKIDLPETPREVQWNTFSIWTDAPRTRHASPRTGVTTTIGSLLPGPLFRFMAMTSINPESIALPEVKRLLKNELPTLRYESRADGEKVS